MTPKPQDGRKGLPWRIDVGYAGCYIFDIDGVAVAQITGPHFEQRGTLIVRAVNNEAALRGALEQAKCCINALLSTEKRDDEFEDKCRAIAQTARAALAGEGVKP
jgi:hypothetical protein